MIHDLGRDIVRHDVVMRVLLDDVHGPEDVVPGIKLLDEPGAVVGSVSKNLREQAHLLPAGLRIFEELLTGVLRVGRQGVIQKRAGRRREQTCQKKRREDPREADPGREHGNDLV